MQEDNLELLLDSIRKEYNDTVEWTLKNNPQSPELTVLSVSIEAEPDDSDSAYVNLVIRFNRPKTKEEIEAAEQNIRYYQQQEINSVISKLHNNETLRAAVLKEFQKDAS